MKIEEASIKAYDRITLYLKSWLPARNVRGVIILIHGFGEHINRYNHWAKRFNNAGWVVTGIDLRGHGLSEGRRGKGSYQDYLHDIDSVFKYVDNKFGDIPKILYGHSMGANLALGYEITRRPDISRLVVSSPWLRLTKPPSGLSIFILNCLSKIFPFLTVSAPLHSSLISRNIEVCEEYKNDPLIHHQIAASSFLQFQEWASIILKNKHKINVPLLILHGKHDQITSWKGSYIFARETSESTHYKIWDNCFHELHNEICNEEVFSYIELWLSNVQNFNVKSNVG